MLAKLSKYFFRIRLFFADQYGKAQLCGKYYGIKMGKNVRMSGRVHWDTEPYLIRIGDNVNLTQEVRFITHAALHIFRDEHPDINYYGRIVVGNNVIIGAYSIVMYDVTIGDNVIIGAGSIVTKSIPSNVVAAGCPARVICTIEEYKEKMLKKAIKMPKGIPYKQKKEILTGLYGVD